MKSMKKGGSTLQIEVPGIFFLIQEFPSRGRTIQTLSLSCLLNYIIMLHIMLVYDSRGRTEKEFEL